MLKVVDEMDVQEVEHALKDTQRAAEKLRAVGLTGEADKMDAMADKLEAALDEEAEDKKKDAELAEAAGERGRTSFFSMLESGDASEEDLERASRDAHDLAAKLRAEGKEGEALEVKKLVTLLDTAARNKAA